MKIKIFIYFIFFLTISGVCLYGDQGYGSLMNAGEYEKAVQELTVLTNDNPQSYYYRYDLAFCLYSMNRKDESMVILKTLLKRNLYPEQRQQASVLVEKINEKPGSQADKKEYFAAYSIISASLGFDFHSSGFMDWEKTFGSLWYLTFNDGARKQVGLDHTANNFDASFVRRYHPHNSIGLYYHFHTISQTTKFETGYKNYSGTLMTLNELGLETSYHFREKRGLDPFFFLGAGYGFGKIHSTPALMTISGFESYDNAIDLKAICLKSGIGLNNIPESEGLGVVFGFRIQYDYSFLFLGKDFYPNRKYALSGVGIAFSAGLMF